MSHFALFASVLIVVSHPRCLCTYKKTMSNKAFCIVLVLYVIVAHPRCLCTYKNEGKNNVKQRKISYLTVY